jgi:hypothetical protein
MRVYDTNPTGFLPGEGCGIIAQMRAADPRACPTANWATWPARPAAKPILGRSGSRWSRPIRTS